MTIEQLLQLMCSRHKTRFQLVSLNNGGVELFEVLSGRCVTAPTIEGAIRTMYKEFDK